MQKRYVLEENGVLDGPRISPLQVDEDDDKSLKHEAKEKIEPPVSTIGADYAFEKDGDNSSSSKSSPKRRRSRSRSRSSESSRSAR